jgi:uncharacterized membrane protein required for colicin V production
MVHWSFAFKRGAVVFLWVLLWSIIGWIIAIAFSLPFIYSIINYATSYLQNPSSTPQMGALYANVGLAIVGGIIGALVTTIGTYATIIKITLEAAEKKMAMPAQTPAAPQQP